LWLVGGFVGGAVGGGFDEEVNKKMDTWQKGESGSLFFYFLPMDRVTHTDDRQTKTHVDKWISGSPKKHLWTKPEALEKEN